MRTKKNSLWGLKQLKVNIKYTSKELKRKSRCGEERVTIKQGFCYFYVFVFAILGPHPRHVEVPRLGVQSEPQLPAYTTATAMQDPSHVCNLHHSSQQCWILNPLSEAGIEPITSWIVGFANC